MNRINNFFRLNIVLVLCFGFIFDLYATQAPNPRTGKKTESVNLMRDARVLTRASGFNVGNTTRSNNRQISRRDNSKNVSARAGTVFGASNARSAVDVRAHNSNVKRGNYANFVRSALGLSVGGQQRNSIDLKKSISRAATARATAVYNDVSKIGGGYATCREAYNTCMDQFCANANDTYRRCYCSDRFTEFHDTENALTEAKTLLQQFQDNNLNAVDKTADEVSAMYKATAGESAIKNDTSAAAATLSNISDLLSGKKKTTKSKTYNLTSLDFSSDLNDIWGESSSSSIFGGSSGVDLSSMEGRDLYNSVNKQCMEAVSDSCKNDSVFSMAKSAYSILITQDCNAYEKKIDSQRQAVENTVREAEKLLRDARLEEYKNHNSADVNACIASVKSALLQDTACGENYKRCLDYSGLYINSVTAEPIYSPALFGLSKLIVLDGSADVLGANKSFDAFLDDRRMFATTALDSCRGIADTVWTEFKRSALIEIAQAQDEKIEEVKNSCISTVKECYDTQTGALASFDTTTAQASAALGTATARAMCADKLMTCASLYDSGTCKYDSSTGKISGDKCGLQSLLNFVDTVDTVQISEGCETALTNYVTDLCTPTSGDYGYPWNCRLKQFGSGNVTDISTTTADGSLTGMIANRANLYCNVADAGIDTGTILESVNKTISEIQMSLTDQLTAVCAESGGVWGTVSASSSGDPLELFYNNVYGTSYADANSKYGVNAMGKCFENTIKKQCELAEEQSGGNGYATYDDAGKRCKFTQGFYEYQCSVVGGIWDGSNCYL